MSISKTRDQGILRMRIVWRKKTALCKLLFKSIFKIQDSILKILFGDTFFSEDTFILCYHRPIIYQL